LLPLQQSLAATPLLLLPLLWGWSGGAHAFWMPGNGPCVWMADRLLHRPPPPHLALPWRPVHPLPYALHPVYRRNAPAEPASDKQTVDETAIFGRDRQDVDL